MGVLGGINFTVRDSLFGLFPTRRWGGFPAFRARGTYENFYDKVEPE